MLSTVSAISSSSVAYTSYNEELPTEFFKGCENMGPRYLGNYEKLCTIIFECEGTAQVTHSLYHNGVEFVLYSDRVPEQNASNNHEFLLVNLDMDQILQEVEPGSIDTLDEAIKFRHILQAIGIPITSVYTINHEADVVHIDNEDAIEIMDRSVIYELKDDYYFVTNHWFLTRTAPPIGAHTIQCSRTLTVDNEIVYRVDEHAAGNSLYL